MKRIGLITIHYANSYGGCLQALASQEVLSRFGQTEILDYKSPHLEKSMKLIRYGVRFRDFLRMAKDCFRLLPRFRLLNKFNAFFDDYYNLSVPLDRKTIKSHVSSIDVLVTGSDQIWNPGILEEFDPTYFLDFTDDKFQMAFSSSMGSYRYNKHEEKLVKKYLSKFNYISVREKDSAEYLSNLLSGKYVVSTIDPTLMLDKSAWMDLLGIDGNKKQNPYVFVYTLKKDRFTRKLIDDVARNLNLDVIVIDQDPVLGYKSDRHYKDACPRQYVELISKASFVITNSFHGTAFAVNFGIPFVSIKPETGANRVISFLESVNLAHRYIDQEFNQDLILRENLDFMESHKYLEKARSETLSFLENALG